MTIDPNISDYIDIAISRERKLFNLDLDRIKEEFRYETDRHMTALQQGFRDDIKLLVELTGSKPDEGRVREIVREEIEPLKSDISLIKAEIGCINGEITGIKGELSSMRREMRQHNNEMKRLRKDVNNHDTRLSTLENVLV